MNYSIEPVPNQKQSLRVVAHLDGHMREQDARLLGYECGEEVFFLHEGEYLMEPGHIEASVHMAVGGFSDGTMLSIYRAFIESFKGRLDGLSHLHEIHMTSCYAELKGQMIERCNWRHAHPFYCRTCYGYGVLQEIESYDTPGFSGPCVCVEDSICPLCGSGTLIDDGRYCSTCGWTYEVTPGAPYVSECDGDYCRTFQHI